MTTHWIPGALAPTAVVEDMAVLYPEHDWV